jgi:cobalt/nickel transport system permease protein
MNNIGRNSFDIRYMDTLAAGDSPLHRLDPRAKLITTLVFIVIVASFDKYSFSALVPFFIYPIVLLAVGGLPARFILRKVLMVSPFAILVGIFNPLLDRQILIYIGSFGISGGWVSFFSILTRFLLTVTSALILISLTNFNSVCASLLRFGVPRPLVMQLLFFYRYISVLTEEAERMSGARSLRSFNSEAINFKVSVSLIGQLLLRTLNRAERIYLAMRCRGFDGSIPMLRPMKFRLKDIIFVCVWIFLFLIFRQVNVSVKAGLFITGLLK